MPVAEVKYVRAIGIAALLGILQSLGWAAITLSASFESKEALFEHAQEFYYQQSIVGWLAVPHQAAVTVNKTDGA